MARITPIHWRKLLKICEIEGCILVGQTGDHLELKKAGAKRIVCFATHAVFASDPKKVIERFDNSAVTELIVTDSIRHDAKLMKGKRVKVTVLPLSALVADAIARIHAGESVSALIT